MMGTYMLQYYDKAILGQAALFNFIPDLQLSVVVSPGPPPVVSTLRFSQGIYLTPANLLIFSLRYLLLWIYSRLLSSFAPGTTVSSWEGLRCPCNYLGDLPIMVLASMTRTYHSTIACFNFPTIMVQRFFLGFLEVYPFLIFKITISPVSVHLSS